MNINLTAKSQAVTPPMKDYALKKVDKLDKYLDGIQVDIVLDTEKERKIAEFIVSVPGQQLVAKGVEENMTAAIDFAIDKMEKQMKRLKSKLKDHNRQKKSFKAPPLPPTDEEEEEEETYQEIVDKTDFSEKAKED